jgi:hypothetical protein
LVVRENILSSSMADLRRGHDGGRLRRAGDEGGRVEQSGGEVEAADGKELQWYVTSNTYSNIVMLLPIEK